MNRLSDTLRNIQANLVKAKAYPTDQPADEDVPVLCGKCKGTGWLSQRVGEYSRRAVPCDVCRQSHTQNFFADLQVKQGNREAIEMAQEFAAHPQGWLTLVGQVGTGKTRLLACVLSTWRGSTRKALTTAELLDFWRQAVDDNNLGPVFNGYCTASTFLLDDLGAERATDWGIERLGMFLDFRYGRKLPTAIATNFDRAGMVAQLGSRIADRVFDQGTGLVRVVSLNVPSFRRLQ